VAYQKVVNQIITDNKDQSASTEMEMVMTSKTNDTSDFSRNTQFRELCEDELQQVSGGSISDMNQMDMLVRCGTGVGGGICPFPDVC
jgi:hypothetical protein